LHLARVTFTLRRGLRADVIRDAQARLETDAYVAARVAAQGLGTGELIREPSRQRFGRPREAISKRRQAPNP
jgi:hypothetical protein